MNVTTRIALVARALSELARYDLLYRTRGLRAVLAMAPRTSLREHEIGLNPEQEACEAMKWAECLYFKRVRCLQHSIALACLLRSQGADASVGFGFRLETVRRPCLGGSAWPRTQSRVFVSQRDDSRCKQWM